MVDIPSEIQVTTRKSTEICIAEMRADIKYIKETLDKTVADHETRIRTLEQTDEDCKQQSRITDFQDRIDDHEVRINALESTHDKDTGVKQAGVNLREWVIIIIAILGWMVSLFQVFGGQ